MTTLDDKAELADAYPVGIGRGSGNGTIREFRRALAEVMERRKVRRLDWRATTVLPQTRVEILLFPELKGKN